MNGWYTVSICDLICCTTSIGFGGAAYPIFVRLSSSTTELPWRNIILSGMLVGFLAWAGVFWVTKGRRKKVSGTKNRLPKTLIKKSVKMRSG